MINKWIYLALALCTLFASTLCIAEDKAGEEINWQVISSGGTKGSSASFILNGTVSQTAVGSGSSVSYGLSHGFWLASSGGASTCCEIRGDINHFGGGPDISDLVYLVTYMFSGGPPPPCSSGPGYYDEADANGSDSGPDISDLVYLVTYMFSGGPAPIPCP